MSCVPTLKMFYSTTRGLAGAWPLYLFIYSHHICVCGLEASAVSPKRARTRGFAPPSVLKQNSGRKNQKQNPKFILIQDKSDESAPRFELTILSCILGK